MVLIGIVKHNGRMGMYEWRTMYGDNVQVNVKKCRADLT